MDPEQKSSGAPALPASAGRGISTGDRLGRFEILSSLGAGGMGEVYRARDAQLQRDVAIKVLPAAFADNADRRRRFEREARAAAGLNHPNILAVHDVGLHDGVPFIVTELLEGETLRQRMNGRPLPARKAVDYAVQIARGLAAGHDRGIIHRDIKPDNLFVTHEGRVKILDFGLARMAEPGGPEDATATLLSGGMAVGRVVGTPAYMSPEQARGLRTDQRSDLFSLGVVLHEMLQGSPPFRRDTPADTVSAILHDDPPDLACTRQLGPALERIVRHCLEKDPEERVQNARDLIFNLESVSLSSSPSVMRPLWRVSRTRLAWGIVAAGIVAAAALGYLAGNRREPGPEASPAVLTSVQRLTDLAGIEESPSISPDGRQVAFTVGIKGRRQIFVRLLAGGSPVQITRDLLDHQYPRWSPDGNALFYFAPAATGEMQGAIWSVPALGGSPRRVLDAIGDADIGRTGSLACFRLQNGRIQLVRAQPDGSNVQVIAALPSGYHVHPRWSPDGRWIAFQQGDGVRNDLFVVAQSGGTPRKLTAERAMIRGLSWLPDSSGLVYASSHGSTIPYLPPLALWQLPLEGGRARQLSAGDSWYEQPDVQGSGLISAARVRIGFDIWKFPFGDDAAENVRRAEQITRQTGQVLTPSEAPDGKELVFLSDSGGHANLWILSIVSGELRQITFEQDPGIAVGVPIWSPDGRSIAFVSSKGRTGFDFGVWLVNPNGTNLRNVVPRGLGMAWSPDGRWLYFAESSAGILYKIPSAGGPPVKVRAEPTRNVIGVHGNTLYYAVERPLLDGRPEHEIRAATPEDGPSRAIARIPASRVANWQIVNPSLSPDGEWLAMPLTDGFTTNIWALSTRTGAWRQVTDFGDRATFIVRRVSWAADGRSILASVGQGDADIVLLRPSATPVK
ncbi:MAG: protein kinase domain-containing protein [Acidobacteriota bacterium]